jgi:hypothetical protein
MCWTKKTFRVGASIPQDWQIMSYPPRNARSLAKADGRASRAEARKDPAEAVKSTIRMEHCVPTACNVADRGAYGEDAGI